MLKALVIKELRESAGIVALTVIGAVYALGELTATPVVPWQSDRLYHYPFVGDSLNWYFWLLAGGAWHCPWSATDRVGAWPRNLLLFAPPTDTSSLCVRLEIGRWRWLCAHLRREPDLDLCVLGRHTWTLRRAVRMADDQARMDLVDGNADRLRRSVLIRDSPRALVRHAPRTARDCIRRVRCCGELTMVLARAVYLSDRHSHWPRQHLLLHPSARLLIARGFQ